MAISDYRFVHNAVPHVEAAAVTLHQLVAAPGHGKRLVITRLLFSNGATAGTIAFLADTGGTLAPEDMADMVQSALAQFTDGKAPVIGVHCHNDLGLATANTLAAIAAGASHVEATVGGFGERAGNAALEEIAFLISAFSERYSISHAIKLSEIAGTSELFDELTGIHTHPNKPVIGRCALPQSPEAAPRSLDPRLRELLRESTIGRRKSTMPSGACLDDAPPQWGTAAEAAPGKAQAGGEEAPYRLESFNVLTGSHAPPVGIVVMHKGETHVTQSSHGTGPIDALFKAVDRSLGWGETPRGPSPLSLAFPFQGARPCDRSDSLSW